MLLLELYSSTASNSAAMLILGSKRLDREDKADLEEEEAEEEEEAGAAVEEEEELVCKSH